MCVKGQKYNNGRLVRAEPKPGPPQFTCGSSCQVCPEVSESVFRDNKGPFLLLSGPSHGIRVWCF